MSKSASLPLTRALLLSTLVAGTGCQGGAVVAPEVTCGNSKLDAGETCDDGNQRSSDGCSSTCARESGFTCATPGQACTPDPTPVCGDGTLDASEACDDGNVLASDGCSYPGCQVEQGYTCPTAGAACVPVPLVCGDGILSAGEECDDGNQASTDGCSYPGCGVEAGYGCPAANQACAPLDATCGNGHVDAGEDCDDGNKASTDGCAYPGCAVESGYSCPTTSGSCAPIGTTCGNSALEAGEGCDDGNQLSSDGCAYPGCTVEAGFACATAGQPCAALTATCGNSNLEAGEQCDDGNQLASDGCSYPSCTVDAGYACATPGQPCAALTATCGDGELDAGEQCDDRNKNSGDGCSYSGCTVEAGFACPNPGAACVALGSSCGNGVLDAGEGCDDGNKLSSDGCSYPSCAVEAGYACANPGAACQPLGTTCGNGRLDPGEQCDDANPLSGDGCSYATCLVESGFACPNPGAACVTLGTSCGDGRLDAGEQCDDGNKLAGDGCSSSTCTIEAGYACPTPGLACTLLTAACGDGRLDAGEQCDDGNELSADGCSYPSCTVETGFACPNPGAACVTLGTSCGNGRLDAGEQCDDGNGLSTDGCAYPACTVETGFACPNPGVACVPVATACGNGTLDSGESCDDGNQVAGDGCSYPTCTIAPDWSCPNVGQACVPIVGTCGNSLLDPGEQCDDGNHLSSDGCAFSACTIEVGFSCAAPGQACTPLGTSCGDGVVQAGEQCDDGNHNSGDGCSYSTCTIDVGFTCPTPGQACVSTAVTCGDGFVTPGEQCDRGASNQDGQYGGCNTNCTWGPKCGDGSPQTPPEACDNGGRCAGSPAVACVLGGAPCADGTACISLNDSSYNGCNANCTPGPHCGDDIKDAPEQCDDGTAANTGGYGKCKNDCTLDIRCGDGQTNGSEACDDGGKCQDSGLACALGGAPCAGGATCVSQNDSRYNGCTATCTTGPHCGDGTKDAPEDCDRGVAGNTGAYNTCDADCTFPTERCGDGTWQTVYGEACDFGAANNTGAYGGCTSLCQLAEHCGDGSPNGPEECDDGINDGLYNGCDIDCTWANYCGDGDPDIHYEACDLGGKCSDDSACDMRGPPCSNNSTCVSQNNNTYSGCRSNCRLAPYCGDRSLTTPEESCDDGPSCEDGARCSIDADCATHGGDHRCYPRSGDGCSAACTIEVGYACPTVGATCVLKCGNGRFDDGELCDDGNLAPGDGCSADCKTVESGYECPRLGQPCTFQCGNHVVNTGEECDDGNKVTSDGCTGFAGADYASGCKIETGWECPTPGAACNALCGNGRVDASNGEKCDNGTALNTGAYGGCNSNCTRAAYCGDGVQNGAEECDMALCSNGVTPCNLILGAPACDTGACTAHNDGSYNGCRASCTLGPRCGDGLITDGETCDDSNSVGGDGCSATCQLEGSGYQCHQPGKPCAVCGNGIIETAAGEKCDDANAVGGDGCNATCTSVETGWDCPVAGRYCVAKRCGDGIVAGGEECDDGNNTSGDGCSSKCRKDARFDGLTPASCSGTTVAVVVDGVVNSLVENGTQSPGHWYKSYDAQLTGLGSAYCPGATVTAVVNGVTSTLVENGTQNAGHWAATDGTFTFPGSPWSSNCAGAVMTAVVDGTTNTLTEANTGAAGTYGRCDAKLQNPAKAACTGAVATVTVNGTASTFTGGTASWNLGAFDAQLPAIAYASCSNRVVTVTVNGVATRLLEGSGAGNQWSRSSSNAAACTNLATAINTYVSGVTAACSGTAVNVTRNAGTTSLSLATSDTACTQIPNNSSAACVNLATQINALADVGAFCAGNNVDVTRDAVGTTVALAIDAGHTACASAVNSACTCSNLATALDGLDRISASCRSGNVQVYRDSPTVSLSVTSGSASCATAANASNCTNLAGQLDALSGIGASCVNGTVAITSDVAGTALGVSVTNPRCATATSGCINLATQIDALPGVAATCATGNLAVTPDSSTRSFELTSSDASCVAARNFSCTNPGSACVAATCGDGAVSGMEQCDDHNAVSADGCSSACQIEAGYSCPTAGSACVAIATSCGAGSLQPGEQCDDGNVVNGDGCSNSCRREAILGPIAYGSCSGTAVTVALNDANYVFVENGSQTDGHWNRSTSNAAGCANLATQIDALAGVGAACVGTSVVVTADLTASSVAVATSNATCAGASGFTCATPGQTCVTTTCGDGVKAGSEQCDDGKACYDGTRCTADSTCYAQYARCSVGGAGCTNVGGSCATSGTCNLVGHCWDRAACTNIGSACVGHPGTCTVDALADPVCTPRAGDGCSPMCRVESIFACDSANHCAPVCGDGITFAAAGEECDDGNNVSGDGCSALCTKETGYTCTDFTVATPTSINVTLGYRDMRARTDQHAYPSDGHGFAAGGAYPCTTGTCYGHPDFEPSTQCAASGMVKTAIAADRTPVFAGGSCLTNATNFGMWYHDTPGVNRRAAKNLTLLQDLVADASGHTYVYDSACKSLGATCSQITNLGDDGGFFPLDGQLYCGGVTNCSGQTGAVNGSLWHNFGFTSEFHAYFQYKGGEVLTFSGDDDVWVFINGILAVDIGGIHGATTGSVTLSSTPDAVLKTVVDRRFNIYENGIYAIDFFQAERHVTQSNYKLTLAGFMNTGTAVCAPTCGDGLVAGAETCDDGNAASNDGCSSTCQIEPGWICPYNPALSKSECHLPTCGDGILEAPVEACDDGNVANGDGCSNTCQIEKCGDANIQGGLCDNFFTVCAGNSDCVGIGTGFCRTGFCSDRTTQCSVNSDCASVGDHVCHKGEQCDDGNRVDDDACTNACRSAACGDMIVRTDITDPKAGGYEACDDGNTSNADNCTNQCLRPYCGDGIVEAQIGEACDDGINNGAYGSCLFDCSAHAPYCGDGVVNGTETCDDGANTGLYGSCLANCSGRAGYCGDGSQNGSEECDDPAGNDGTTCNTDCTLPTICGDTIVNPYAGEDCDKGTSGNTGIYDPTPHNSCTPVCLWGPYCGDGTKNGPEQCDSGTAGNTGGYDKCKVDCTLDIRCGDGTTQAGDGEQCDVAQCADKTICLTVGATCGDGSTCTSNNFGAYAGCNPDCTVAARCGDGVVDAGYEDCDLATCASGLRCVIGGAPCADASTCTSRNTGAYNTCSATCKQVERCGDGIVQAAFGETCDDGVNDNSYNGCTSTCQKAAFCGDGNTDPGEECDLGGKCQGGASCAVGGAPCGDGSTCVTQNTGAYDGCRPTCKLAPRCGDTLLTQPNEACDGTAFGGKTCMDLNGNGIPGELGDFTGGVLTCNPPGVNGCMLDTSGCFYCGNGVKNDREECDGIGLCGASGVDCGSPAATCGTYGFTDKPDQGLGCKAGCTFDLSGCVTTSCGNGARDEFEQCEGTDLGGKTCADMPGFNGGTLACKPDCTYDTSGCGFCGDGVKNGTETCDGTDLGGQTCATQGKMGGRLACNATCTGFDTSACYQCNACSDCNFGEACVDHACGGCNVDSDCCAPLYCVFGTCMSQ